MKSKHIGIFSAAAVTALTGALVLFGLASISSADSGGPTVVLSSTASSTTMSTSIPVTATFSESVNGFSSAGVTATNATVGAISGSGSTYTFTIMPEASGTVTVMLPDNAATSTASSTGSQASNMLTFTYSPAATSTQTAYLALSAYSGPPGSSVNALGSNFAANEQVAVGFGNATTTTSADASGDFTLPLTVPSLATGSAQITAMGQSSGLVATNSFYVEAATSTGSTTSPTAPNISNIQVTNVDVNDATITWTTDAAASTQVFYGTTSSYGSMSTLDSTATTTHSVTISGLSEATLYHFDVQSTDTNGTATSADTEFMTESTASTTPLAVSGATTVQGSATADGTFADGWEWILHFTVPGVEDNFAMSFGDFTSSTTSSTIPAANDIRIWSPESSNASTTDSALMETGNGYSTDMDLTGDTATTTAGRQIDVYINVAVPAGTPTGTYSTTFGAMSTTTPF